MSLFAKKVEYPFNKKRVGSFLLSNEVCVCVHMNQCLREMGKTGSEKNKHAKDSRHKQTQLNKYSGDTEGKGSWNT